MNAHQRFEAKRARRWRRTTDPTHRRYRGPITRAAARVGREKVGAERIFEVSRIVGLEPGERDKLRAARRKARA